MRGENKKNKISILVIASILVILVAMILIISSGVLQQKVPDTNLKKITNPSSVGSGSIGGGTGTISSNSLSSSLSSSLSGGGAGGSSPNSGGVILTDAEAGSEYPQFSNLLDNSGTQVSSGIGYFNVTVTSTNGTVILDYNDINYTASTDNWLNLDGIDDYVSYGYNSKYSPQNNISFYVRFTPNNVQDMDVVSKGAGGEYQYALKLTSINTTEGGIYFLVYQSNGDNHCDTSSILLPSYTAEKEYIVYAEYINQTSCSIQVNNGNKATQTSLIGTAGVNNETSWADLRVGNRADGVNFFNGSVSEFIFYDPTLITPIINTQYNEGYGTIAYDSSGFGNNGTIYNGATWSNNQYTASLNVTSGTYLYKWYSWGNGTTNDYNESEQRSYIVNATPDITPPYFTTIPATTNINYTRGFGVDFNATDETGFGTYAIDWTTLFKINSNGWLTNSTPNIAAGSYYINVTINDTSNNLNSTIYLVNVAKATPALIINGTTPINYSTTTNVAGSGCASQLTCSLSPTNGVYGAGTVTFNYSTAGNANYTAGSVTKDIVINKATLTLTINGTTPITYGTITNVIGDSCPSQLICSLDKTNEVYGAGTITFNYSTSGNANYSAGSITKMITINKATPLGSVSGTSPINYGTAGDVTGTENNIGDEDTSYKLFRNNIEVSNPDTTILSVGTYNYVYNTTGGANWSARAIINNKTLIVNKISSQDLLTITGTTPITYGTATDVVGDSCPTQLTCSLDKTNGIYGAGTVTFNYSTAGNANYTSGSITKIITINKTISALAINGTTPIVYGTMTDVTGSGCASQLTCSLSPSNGIYGVGTITFNYSTAGNANYSASSITKNIVISSKITPVLTITGTTSIVYGTATNVAVGGCPSQLTCSLSPSNGIYGAGTVTFNYSTSGNVNYSASSITKMITINKATLNYAVTLTSPINYPTASNYIGRITNGETSCSPILYRNDVNIGTGFSVSDTSVLSAGTYTYRYSTAGCVNYTDSENVKTLIVNLVACYSNSECDDSNSHTQDVCSNAGTPSSSCSHSAIACLTNSECDDSNAHTQDVCNNPGTTQSSCSNSAIACLSDSECGTNGFVSTPVCQSNNVWQNFVTYTCSNAGTPSSSCTSSTILQSKETCAVGGGCIDGRCKVKSCTTVCSYGTCKEYCVWQ